MPSLRASASAASASRDARMPPPATTPNRSSSRRLGLCLMTAPRVDFTAAFYAGGVINLTHSLDRLRGGDTCRARVAANVATLVLAACQIGLTLRYRARPDTSGPGVG